MRLAEQAVSFVSPRGRDVILEPTEPLRSGIFRLVSDVGAPPSWKPVPLEEWEQETPRQRLSLVLCQMNQVALAQDAQLTVRIDVTDDAIAAISPAEVRAGFERALCWIYRQAKNHPQAVPLFGQIAGSLLQQLFGPDIPLLSLSDEAALALIVAYGATYCVQEASTDANDDHGAA